MERSSILKQTIHSIAVTEAHAKAHSLAQTQATLGSEFLPTYLKVYTQEFQRIYETTHLVLLKYSLST